MGRYRGKASLAGLAYFLKGEFNVNNLKIVIYSITEVKKVKMREEKRRDMAKVAKKMFERKMTNVAISRSKRIMTI